MLVLLCAKLHARVFDVRLRVKSLFICSAMCDADYRQEHKLNGKTVLFFFSNDVAVAIDQRLTYDRGMNAVWSPIEMRINIDGGDMWRQQRRKNSVRTPATWQLDGHRHINTHLFYCGSAGFWFPRCVRK